MRRQKTRGNAFSVVVGLSSLLGCNAPPTEMTPPPPRGTDQGGPQIPRVGAEGDAAMLALETVTQVLAGGPVEASRQGGECRGHIGFMPHFRVTAEGARPLRFMAQGDGDLTIVVRGPSGQRWCNDDSDGLNPMVEVPTPVAGTYLVYIGTYSSERLPARALVTTDMTRTPTQISGAAWAGALSHEVESSTGANAPLVGEACTVAQDVSNPAQTHWRVTCGARVYYEASLPPNDPSWPTGTLAYDAAMSSADQTPMFVWNAEGILLRDDEAGSLGELQLRLRTRTVPVSMPEE